MPRTRFCPTFLCLLLVLWLIGCGEKSFESRYENAPNTLLTRIIEVDEHSNVVTELRPEAFAEQGWALGDTLEVVFSTGQSIRIKYVEDYGDVPEGEYLGRFSSSRGIFKIAINRGKLAEALSLKPQTQLALRKHAL